MSKTTSINKAQDQCELTLSPIQYKIDDSGVHVVEKTIKMERIDECGNEAIGESMDNTCNENIRETELYETRVEIKVESDNDKELNHNTEDVSDVKPTIKSEPVNRNDEQEVTDNRYFTIFVEQNEIKSAGSGVGNQENELNESSKLCKIINIKQRRKRRHNPNQTSTTLPRCKELVVVLEDIMLSKYNTQHKRLSDSASTTRSYGNDYRSAFNDSKVLEALTKNTDATKALKYENTTSDNSTVSDPCNISQSISTKISNVNSNNLIRNDTESSKKLFICVICNEEFQCKSTLIQHIMKHKKMHNCTFCSYRTNRKFDLNAHVNSQHTKNTVYRCSYCNFKSHLKITLNSHVNAKHTKRAIFSCSYCSYKAYQKCNIDQHINSQHTRVTVFNCSDCDYTSYYKGDLNKHINSQHTKIIAFNCSYCSYKAHKKYNLDQHVNSQHTKSTVFNCTFCGYRTYYKSDLSKHINSQHTKNTVK